MSLTAGSRLGPYEVLAPIGAGGMGEVYRARDTRLNRTVALKVLPAELAADPERRARFEREAHAIAALSHPHICTIHDVGCDNGTDYLVMELLEGETLADRLARAKGRPLPIADVLRYATEIADALDKAHRAGIVHRDLKPANIMLTKSGSKLLDFGLAKLKGPALPISMTAIEHATTTGPKTATGTILGTLHYMAPEQVEGREADARSDIWAVGVVIYEMVTGGRPFDGDSPASVIGAILKDDPLAISRVQPLAPRLLDRIVSRCLARDPDDRWQSARDMRIALDWSGEATRPVARRSVSPARWAGAAIVLLASATTLVWLSGFARTPTAPNRALSLEVSPPPGGKFVLSPTSGGAAISPDGMSVAFVARVEGVERLWVRPLESIKARELPDTDDAFLPFWSPDSRSLGYFAHGNLRRIDAAGGASTVLAAVANPRGASWGANGTIVFADTSGPLQRISASGGTPSPLTSVAASETTHRWPRFLPDGRTLLFFAQGERPGVYLTTVEKPAERQRVLDASLDAVYVPPRNGGLAYLLGVQGDSLAAQPFDVDSRRFTGPSIAVPGAGDVLTSTGSNRSNLSVANDGTILYALGSNRYQVTWYGADGATLRTLGTPDRYVGLRLSPDDTQTLGFIDDSVGNRDAWRVDVARGVRTRVTSDNHGNFGIWSPDGQAVAYTGLTRQTLFEKGIVGAAAERTLVRSNYQIYPSDWSRDGKYILFTQIGPGYDVWLLSTGSESKANPFLQSPAGERHAQFSPDGRLIAFVSNESGRDEVYIQAFADEKQRKPVSVGGGRYPRWSKKGNELFYLSPDSHLMAAAIRVNGVVVDVGESRSVMQIIEPPAVELYPYDVAADNRILALAPVRGTPTNTSLNVLVDWQAALRGEGVR